ncbi:MAG TPA: hypothetical protein VI893_00350, partial [Thermoplasmata archaeon]|nr:hypothetical protein [Thermoplasmata archaeon]
MAEGGGGGAMPFSAAPAQGPLPPPPDDHAGPLPPPPAGDEFPPPPPPEFGAPGPLGPVPVLPIEEEKEPSLVSERESSIAYLLTILTAAMGFYYYARFRWDRAEENAREVARNCLILGSISFFVYLWLIFTTFAEWTVTYNQFLFTGLVRGAIFSLYAIGLTLVYKILKLSNFAQAELFTVGGY